MSGSQAAESPGEAKTQSVKLAFGLVAGLEVSKDGTGAERKAPLHGYGFVPLTPSATGVGLQVRIEETEDLEKVKGGLEIGFSPILPTAAELENKFEFRQVTALKTRAVYVDKMGMAYGAVQTTDRKLWDPLDVTSGSTVVLWLGAQGTLRFALDGKFVPNCVPSSFLPAPGSPIYGFVNVFSKAKRVTLLPCVLDTAVEQKLVLEDRATAQTAAKLAAEKKAADDREKAVAKKRMEKAAREATVDRAMCFTLWVDDNFHQGERFAQGIYSTYEEAERDAKEMMEAELREALRQGKSATQWQVDTTGMYGEDLWIGAPPGQSAPFRSEDYAKVLVARVQKGEKI